MKKSLLTLLGIFLFGTVTSFSQLNFLKESKDKLKFYYEYTRGNCGLNNEDSMLILDGINQKMYLVSNEDDSLHIFKEYLVSTGKKGFGVENNSEKTPFGIHKIVKKIGDGVPVGGIFLDKKYVNKKAIIHKKTSNVKKDYMTTRVFVLDGMEEFNSNTYSRKILMHGTNKEYFLGLKKSHGCIRMKNEDILELDSLIKEGTYLYIFHE